MPLLLRSRRRHEARNDVDQTLPLAMGSSTPDGLRRQVVWKLGVLVGMHKPRMINQEAQAHAVACALCAGLLGQLAPACIRLPVLEKHFHLPDIMPPKVEAFTR